MEIKNLKIKEIKTVIKKLKGAKILNAEAEFVEGKFRTLTIKTKEAGVIRIGNKETYYSLFDQEVQSVKYKISIKCPKLLDSKVTKTFDSPEDRQEYLEEEVTKRLLSYSDSYTLTQSDSKKKEVIECKASEADIPF